jgi:hypothetical protein
MSFKSYGFGTVIRKGKVVVKGEKTFLKLILGGVGNLGDEKIEALLFKRSNSKNQAELSSININNLIYLEGTLSFKPVRILSSSFIVFSNNGIQKKHHYLNGIIDDKVLQLALSKAYSGLNSNADLQDNNTPKMHSYKEKTPSKKHNKKSDDGSRDAYSPTEFKHYLG